MQGIGDIGHLSRPAAAAVMQAVSAVCATLAKEAVILPADGIPQGDNSISTMWYEVGHQLGANHIFSMSNEGSGVNKEPGPVSPLWAMQVSPARLRPTH